MTDRTLEIVGAGPAGLAAAITAARKGARVVVYDRAREPGARFHGDFQGLESWSTEEDVLAELAELGVEPTFEHIPIRRQRLWDPDGREHVYASGRPFYYLVRRGSEAGTLDAGLVRQARDLGVEIRWGIAVHRLPRGGIVAGGPRGADAIAVGYLFETDLADGCWAALCEALAPGGYAYLLVHGGRGTLATCMFDDFAHQGEYLERTRELFQRRLGFTMRDPRRFGGAGNFRLPETAHRGDLLFAGEAAGFQDPFWGFGMRYAMVSGHLAARAWLEGSPASYDRLWEDRLAGRIRAAAVNRFTYGRLGDLGYRLLVRRLDRVSDPRAWLRRRFARRHWKDLLFPLVRRSAVGPVEGPEACRGDGCDCVRCRCRHRDSSPTRERESSRVTPRRPCPTPIQAPAATAEGGAS